MVVMGVCAFILCNRHRWHIKQKNQKQWKHTKQIYPEQKTKKSCALHHLCPVHEVLTGIWNPLISAQIVNSFGQGKCTFDCQSGNLKKLCLWQPCLNKLMHVDRELKYWSPSTLLLCGHFIQIHSCMSICFSCMYTNNYKHFHKSPIFFYYNHTCRRVKWGEHGSYETLATLP